MKSYIKKLIILAIPIAIAQLLLNLASLLDTIMVGQLDEASVSGVYIATQIVFVINFLILGATEGSSVFFGQFFGAKNKENMTKSFVFKIYASFLFSSIATLIIALFKKPLVALFTADLAAQSIGVTYLNYLIFSFIPYGISISIITTLREDHHPLTSMLISTIGILINLILNYILIFGKLGCPELKAEGAAIGTLVERLIEVISCILFCAFRKYDFVDNLFKNLKIEKELLKKLIIKSIPLLINEFLWALGQTMMTYLFSKQNAIATIALPIATTVYQLMYVFCIGAANGITILVGNTIGEENYDRARKEATYSIIFSIILNLIIGLIMFLLANPIVNLYKGVGSDAKNTARTLLQYYSFLIILFSTCCTIFYLLRAGGRTLIVFCFDSLYTWIIQILLMFIFLKTLDVNFTTFFLITHLIDIIKVTVGLILIYSNKWYKNIINSPKQNKIIN